MQIIPTLVSVDLPFDNATEVVAAAVTTTAEQLLQQLSLQRNVDYFRTWCLCLRRGDHLTWLEPDDLVVTLPVVFKVRSRGRPPPFAALDTIDSAGVGCGAWGGLGGGDDRATACSATASSTASKPRQGYVRLAPVQG